MMLRTWGGISGNPGEHGDLVRKEGGTCSTLWAVGGEGVWAVGEGGLGGRSTWSTDLLDRPARRSTDLLNQPAKRSTDQVDRPFAQPATGLPLEV